MKEDFAVFHDSVWVHFGMLRLLLQSPALLVFHGCTFSGVFISNYNGMNRIPFPDCRDLESEQLYKRLDEAEKERSRFQGTNQRLQVDFSNQRKLLSQISDRAKALNTTGVSNEDRKAAIEIRSWERLATDSFSSAV